MSRFSDLTGSRYGNLIVTEFAYYQGGKSMWQCSCDCDHPLCKKSVIVRGAHMKSGHTLACGVTSDRHNQSKLPEYAIWTAMRGRCDNPKDTSFRNYGGRGITYCERWKIFENFISDMGRRPRGNLSLERKDNNSNYSPANCTWASRSLQNTNQRRTVGVSYDKRLKKWVARISKEYIKYHLGSFETREQALKAYRTKRKELYGIS